jgi:hypothetical protein
MNNGEDLNGLTNFDNWLKKASIRSESTSEINELNRFHKFLNEAIKAASNSGNFAKLAFTILSDLMQIECQRINNVDLLEFEIPLSLQDVVTEIAESTDCKLEIKKSTNLKYFKIEFENENQQDKFLKFFLSMSVNDRRAYPTPNIYLGKPKVDQLLCSQLLDALNKVAEENFEKVLEPSNSEIVDIKNIQCGAIYYQANIASFEEPSPKFEQMDQPTRCYLVKYENGLSKFFWSKPDQYGPDANFITASMKEEQPRDGERYFNDAYQGQDFYSVTLTLTGIDLFDGKSFVYKQEFDNLIGAFIGNLLPIPFLEVPPGWLQVFEANAPLGALRGNTKSSYNSEEVRFTTNPITNESAQPDPSLSKHDLHQYSNHESATNLTPLPKQVGSSFWLWVLAATTIFFVFALLLIQTYPKETNINDLASLQQPSALIGVGAKDSVLNTSLTELFGKSGVNGVLKENSNELSSLFVQAPFFHNEKEHLVVFIKTQALDEKTGNPIECHACSVKLSAVVFSKEGGAWVYLSKSKFFTEFGSWGDAVLNDPIKIEQNFSKNSTAFLIVSGWSGQGYTDEFTTIITYRDNKWQDLGSINTGSDNQGACDESEQAKSTGDFKACWQNKGSLTVVRSKDSDYPDIIVMRSGTKSTKNNDVVAARGSTYHFKKTKYSSDENSVE